jgi:hypothetical protein
VIILNQFLEEMLIKLLTPYDKETTKGKQEPFASCSDGSPIPQNGDYCCSYSAVLVAKK